jgi:O-antigen ligase
VSDRAADYDAVRPDVWSHLLFGRGWGSYDHVAYRVLDSEILHRVIEMGVLGLLAYLLMIGSVLGTARATIAERDRTWAPMALMGAAAAVSFGVASTLFDVMAFPHAVYIFLCMGGFVAAVVSHHRDDRRFVPDLRTSPALSPGPAPAPVALVPSPQPVGSRSS